MFKDCVHVQLLHKRKRDIRNADSDISFSSFKASMLLHCFFFFLSLFGNTNSKMSIFFSIYLFFLPIMANHDPKSSNWCIYYRLVKRTAAFECLCSHSLFLPASMHCLLVTSKQNNDSEWLSIIQSIQNRNV